MNECVVITGGGTGGHLKVADAFIDELKNRNIDVIFIGSSNGQDKQWFLNDKRLKEAYFLDTKGVVNKNAFGKVLSLFNILKKMFFCLRIFSKYNVKKVISVGGFSAAAATFASIVCIKTKLYIHEQNSVLGKLNKITLRFSSGFYSSFDNKSNIKDYPVSREFFDNSRLRNEIKTIAFFGGSQGAVAINDFALSLAKNLDEKGIKIIHQTGKNDFLRVKDEYEKLNIKADVFDFTTSIVEKMKEADFAVSRAGASTMWELCANKLPTLFIPYKYAAANHQYYNAKVIEDKNLCFILEENNLNKKEFLKFLQSDFKTMSENLADSIKKDGVCLILDDILK